ncbi:DNA polymerase A family protein [Micromonospora parva]|uniref:DNA polymerase A family protein n=1 Tax=Micromonospora parva TaxID=1464048 RepID=UPI0033D468BC
MRTFTPTLGGEQVEIAAPEPGRFDATAFRAAFPPSALYGLDVEGFYMDDLGQFSPDFGLRLIQFGTAAYAWVLTLDDPVQRAAAIELLSDLEVSFCSHTSMDVLSVATQLGVDITARNVDTRMLAAMAAPDDKRGGKDLKTLVTAHIGAELEAAEKVLADRFTALWLASEPSRKKPARSVIDAYGWANIPLDDPDYLTYAGLDAVACRRLANVLVPLTEAPPALLEVETWLAGEANRIQLRGMRVDQAALDALSDEARRETSEAEAIVVEISGGIPARSPKIQDWLGEHGVDWDTWEDRGGALTDTGKPSLAKNNVKLLLDYPLDEQGRAVAEQLIRFKSHQDALNKTSGLLTLVAPDGRLHPSLNTLGAVTGRMSSSGPNFQNFSKKDPRMRGLFLPEPGHVLLTADFDQVELRVVAALARETKMIDVILAGGDLHQLTVDELAESGIEITRDTAKMTNFLIVYGGGGRALHEQADIPLEDAQNIVATFRERYPAINDLSRAMGQFRDSIRTISHRRIPVTTNKQGDLRTYANINYLVQSSARDLLVDAWHRFAHEFGRGPMVWFPVHDELVLQVPEALVDQVTDEVQRCMRFDFMGVPISASAVALIDEDGTSRWMTSKRAEAIAAARSTPKDS